MRVDIPAREEIVYNKFALFVYEGGAGEDEKEEIRPARRQSALDFMSAETTEMKARG